MSCNNNGSIKKTFIIEPLSITGGSPTLTACTSLYTNLVQSCSGDTSISLGNGTVIINGNTNVIGNITASTIEALTYLSGGTNILDIINSNDTFVTGGTFNNFTDSIALTRNDGANVIITGLTDFYTTGATLINDTVYFDRNDTLSAFTLDLSSIDLNDTFVTGFTYDGSNNLTVTRNDGISLTTSIDTMSGMTINGILNVTGDSIFNDITASTISADIFSGNTGPAVYHGDGSNLTDIDNFFTTAATLNGNILSFNRNDTLTAFTVDLTSFVDDTNTYVTGGTYSNDIVTLTRNDDVNINITGVTDFFTTGATLIGTTAYFNTNNQLSAYTLNLSSFIDDTNSYTTGATQIGAITYFNRNDQLSAYTIDYTNLFNAKADLTKFVAHTANTSNPHQVAFSSLTSTGHTHPTSDIVGYSDFFTTAATLNGTVLSFDRNDLLSAFTVNLNSLLDDTNTFTTGTTLINNIAYFDTNTTLSAYTLNLSGFVSTDFYVTGATFTGDTLTLTRNDNVDISVTGFSNSDIYTTGTTRIDDTVYFNRNDSMSAYSFTLTGLSTSDFFVTGGTFSGNELTLTRNDAVSMLVTGFTGSDTYTTGSTLIGDIAYFDTIGNLSAYTLDLSALSVSATTDFYTTGSTLIGNVLYFDRNDLLSAYTVDLSTIVTSGGTGSGGTDTILVTGSRAKANQVNLFLRHNDGTPYNIIPYRTYRNGTITKVVASGRDVDTWEARILTGTTVSTDTIYTLPLNSLMYKYDDNPNVSVTSGTTLYLYASGTSIAYPTIDVYFTRD